MHKDKNFLKVIKTEGKSRIKIDITYDKLKESMLRQMTNELKQLFDTPADELKEKTLSTLLSYSIYKVSLDYLSRENKEIDYHEFENAITLFPKKIISLAFSSPNDTTNPYTVIASPQLALALITEWIRSDLRRYK